MTGAPRMRILVADGSCTVLTLERMLLEAYFDVFAVRDGAEVVAHAAVHRPHLIVLDAALPNVNGVAVCRALRARADLKDIPVIMVTAGDERPSTTDGVSAYDDYVRRPLDGLELLTKIRRHLPA